MNIDGTYLNAFLAGDEIITIIVSKKITSVFVKLNLKLKHCRLSNRNYNGAHIEGVV